MCDNDPGRTRSSRVRWLGIAEGNPWWTVDRARSSALGTSVVKLVPTGTFWTACFSPKEPVVDVNIVLPARSAGNALEVVDLEPGILRSADGNVWVRDREEFDLVREVYALPDAMAMPAMHMCEQVRALVELGAEPFTEVGRTWLTRFIADTGATRHDRV